MFENIRDARDSSERNFLRKYFQAEDCQANVLDDDPRYVELAILSHTIEEFSKRTLQNHDVTMIVAKSAVCNAGALSDGASAAIIFTTGMTDYIRAFCDLMSRTTRLDALMSGDVDRPMFKMLVNPFDRAFFVGRMCAPDISVFPEEKYRDHLGAQIDLRRHYDRSHDLPEACENHQRNFAEVLALCLQFFAYHELGHVALQHCEIKRELRSHNLCAIFENSSANTKYDQVMEIEADTYAIKSILYWCVENEVLSSGSEREQFSTILNKCMLAKYLVLTFLLALRAKDREFVDDPDSTHPHALLRHQLASSQVPQALASLAERFPGYAVLSGEQYDKIVNGDLAYFVTEAAFSEFNVMPLENDWGKNREFAIQSLDQVSRVSKELQAMREKMAVRAP